MDTKQLLRCVDQDKILKKYCLGIFAADTVPTTVNLPACYIANTDPISKPGTHWIAVFLDGKKEFFDSYGRPPPAKCAYNTVRIQGPLSSTCGQYCLYYLCHKVRGRPMKEIVNDYSSVYVLNDLCVTEFINRNFDLNTSAYELENILSQISRAE